MRYTRLAYLVGLKKKHSFKRGKPSLSTRFNCSSPPRNKIITTPLLGSLPLRSTIAVDRKPPIIVDAGRRQNDEIDPLDSTSGQSTVLISTARQGGGNAEKLRVEVRQIKYNVACLRCAKSPSGARTLYTRIIGVRGPRGTLSGLAFCFFPHSKTKSSNGSHSCCSTAVLYVICTFTIRRVSFAPTVCKCSKRTNVRRKVLTTLGHGERNRGMEGE